MNHETPSPSQVLLLRGVMRSHAERSEELLESPDERWRSYLDQLTAFPQTHPRGGIGFLIGKRGTGKSQMAACAMRRLITSPDEFLNPIISVKWSVRYISAVDLYMAFRDAIKQGRELDTLRGFTEPRLLVIDDIHEQAGTDHEQRSLTRLLDARLGAMHHTVLITNSQRKDLAAAVGPSITSRFHEAGMVIEVEGRNYRTDDEPVPQMNSTHRQNQPTVAPPADETAPAFRLACQ